MLTPDIISLDQITQLIGTTGPIYSLGWSPDGSMIASAGYEQVNLWDASKYEQIATLRGHTSYVWDVDWSPDGNIIA